MEDDLIIVEGPDGDEFEFPAGTSQDVIQNAMRNHYKPGVNVTPGQMPAGPTPDQTMQSADQMIGGINEIEASGMEADLRRNPEARASIGPKGYGDNPGQPVKRFAPQDPLATPTDPLIEAIEKSAPSMERGSMMLSGNMGGFADEFAGLVAGEHSQTGMRENIQAGREKRPVESFMLEAASSAPTAMGIHAAAPRLGAGSIGAIEGGLYGAGESNADSVGGRALGASIGAPLGAILGNATGGGINIGRRLKAQTSSQPTVASSAQDEFGVSLTEGQITRDPGEVAFEQSAAVGARGPEAQGILRPFMDDQKEAITAAGKTIAGDNFDRVNTAGAAVSEGLQRRARGAQDEISAAYETARGYEVSLNADGVASMPEGVRNNLPDDVKFMLDGIESGSVEARTFPALTTALEAVDRIKAGSVQEFGGVKQVTEVQFDYIELARRSINNTIDAAGNPADRRMALKVKHAFDQYIDDAVDAALFTGDEAFLGAYKSARGLRADFAKNFEAERVFEKLIQNDASPEQTLEYILGANKIAPTERVRKVVPQLKRALGEDSPEWHALQEAAMLRVMRQTEQSFDPKVLLRNLDELIVGRNESVAKELFSTEQYNKLRRFRAVVERVTPPPGTTNPSGSGYEIGRLLSNEAGALFKGGPLGRLIRASLNKVLPDQNAVKARNAINPRSILADTEVLAPDLVKPPAMPAGNARALGIGNEAPQQQVAEALIPVEDLPDPITNGVPSARTIAGLLSGAKPEPITPIGRSAPRVDRTRRSPSKPQKTHFEDGRPTQATKIYEMATGDQPMSRAEIADEMEMSLNQVSVIATKLRNEGREISFKPSESSVGKNGEKTAMAVALKRQGFSYEVIAKRMNAVYGPGTVHDGTASTKESIGAMLTRTRDRLEGAGKAVDFGGGLLPVMAATGLAVNGTDEAAALRDSEESEERGGNVSGTNQGGGGGGGNNDEIARQVAEAMSGPQTPVKLPLHMQLKAKGIAFENWPEAAKQALDPRERAAYEEEASRQPPANNNERLARFHKQQRDDERNNQPYRDTPEAARAEAAQQGQDLFKNASATRRAQLEQVSAALQPYDSDDELMGAPTKNVRWQEMVQGLQAAVDSGDMTREQAAAELDKHMSRTGVDRRLNPFRQEDRRQVG